MAPKSRHRFARATATRRSALLLCALCLATESLFACTPPDLTPPVVTIAKPAVDGEYVTGGVFVKAYITDASGILVAKVYVDGTYKGDMVQEDDYWRYSWNSAGTSKGPGHVIRVDAMDRSPYRNVGRASRSVWCHPQAYLPDISFLGCHSLWDRAKDEAIVAPQWKDSPTETHPVAYTVGTQMTVSPRLTSTDITDSVNIRTYVVGTWRNRDGVALDTFVADKTASGSFPCSVAHYPTAYGAVMNYSLDETYSLYVRKSSNSDWCSVGARYLTHPEVYLTFGDPIGPWGPSGTPRACWDRVLRDACTWMPITGYTSTQKLDARKRLAYKAFFNSNKNYTGSRSHCSTDGSSFNMDSFLRETEADCRDMSSWWTKLCNAVGMNGQLQRLLGPDLATKLIDPVGNPDWTTQVWNFHQLGVYTNVFDACLAVDSVNPRVPMDEALDGSYKSDFYDSGPWDPQAPFSLQEVN